MSSPLGKYGQVVAAMLAVAVIGTYLIALVFTVPLGVPEASINALDKAAFLALGAVFGAAAAVNGVKPSIDAAHTRVDKLEVATGIPTHGSHIATSSTTISTSTPADDRPIDTYPPAP